MTVETQPNHSKIPVFVESGLYLPNTEAPTPKIEIPLRRDGSANLFFVGKYEKGKAFIIRPRDPNSLTFHLEHRFQHNPIEDLGISNPNLPQWQQIREELDIRKNTFIDEENYKKLLETSHRLHRLTQELIRDHVDMISRIIDPTTTAIVEPECFLEVGLDFINSRGDDDKKAIDAVVITHGGTVVLIEVASRKQDNDDLRRTKKYDQIMEYSKKFRKQFAEKLGIEESELLIVEACVFYEEINDKEIYASFRFTY